jgi:hypothetical protein
MILDTLGARTLCGFTKALTGARILWRGCAPDATQRVYFGNHGVTATLRSSGRVCRMSCGLERDPSRAPTTGAAECSESTSPSI